MFRRKRPKAFETRTPTWAEPPHVNIDSGAVGVLATAMVDALGDRGGPTEWYAGAGSTAGTIVIRRISTIVLEQLEPGSGYISAAADDIGPRMLDRVFASARVHGVPAPDSPVGERPRPAVPHVELSRVLEPVAVDVLGESLIDERSWPDYVMFAGLELYLRREPREDPGVWAALLIEGLVHGIKTVPYPIGS